MALSREEVDKRVSVLRRLKENLLKQREKFQSYLVVLEKEKDSIETGQVEILQSQVALEENIVAEIYSFQKVIDPLEEIYKASYPAEDHDHEVQGIKASLETLKSQVLEKNKHNRTLLTSRMETVRQEILSIKRRPNRNLFSGGSQGPSLIDITT